MNSISQTAFQLLGIVIYLSFGACNGGKTGSGKEYKIVLDEKLVARVFEHSVQIGKGYSHIVEGSVDRYSITLEGKDKLVLLIDRDSKSVSIMTDYKAILEFHDGRNIVVDDTRGKMHDVRR